MKAEMERWIGEIVQGKRGAHRKRSKEVRVKGKQRFVGQNSGLHAGNAIGQEMSKRATFFLFLLFKCITKTPTL